MPWAEKLPSGKYRGMYRAGGKQRSVGTFSHKARALREAGAAEDDARSLGWADPDAAARTWGAWADEWWPSRTVAPSTLRVDAMRRARHLDPRWGDVPLADIKRHDIKAWAASLIAGGLSPETAKRCVHLLSASLASAVDAEVIAVNPASRLKIASASAVHERYLTREEFAALREQMPFERDRLVLDMLVNTGLRWGELAGLHASRVDLERGVVRVAETWDERSGLMKSAPKGKRPRTVPLLPSLVERLRDLPHEGQTCGYEHDLGRCPGPLLLTTDKGSVLRNQAWAGQVFRPAVLDAGIGHARVHDLRHTYASWLLQRGVSLAEVGALLGHRSPATTQRYAHLQEEPSAAVLAALSEV